MVDRKPIRAEPSRIVAIHQPNFFPWLGYFDKIARCDDFIILDHVQYQKTGGVWSNRVKFLIGGEARWVTAPIVRNYHGFRATNEVEFQTNDPWRQKFLKSLAANYAKAPFYRLIIEFLEPLILNPDNNLAEYNSTAIMAIAKLLGMPEQKFHWSSSMKVDNHATEMLVSLTKEVGGNQYLCGGGAEGYQIDEIFFDAAIELCYQNYQSPIYPQVGSSQNVPGLSIVDALMNIGIEEVRAVLGLS